MIQQPRSKVNFWANWHMFPLLDSCLLSPFSSAMDDLSWALLPWAIASAMDGWPNCACHQLNNLEAWRPIAYSQWAIVWPTTIDNPQSSSMDIDDSPHIFDDPLMSIAIDEVQERQRWETRECCHLWENEREERERERKHRKIRGHFWFFA